MDVVGPVSRFLFLTDLDVVHFCCIWYLFFLTDGWRPYGGVTASSPKGAEGIEMEMEAETTARRALPRTLILRERGGGDGGVRRLACEPMPS